MSSATIKTGLTGLPNNTIAIFGQYKTGTTIIFQTIRESLTGRVVYELFEPSKYVEVQT